MLFDNCQKLRSIDLSKFDTNSVITFSSMFSHCEKIKSIDASSFKATNANNINDMFSYNYELISLDLSNFDTSKVENMQGVFYLCGNLKYLNLKHFSDKNMIDMYYIPYFFDGCTNLLYLNLRSFITTITNNNINYNYVFQDHPSNIKYCIEDSNTIIKVIGDKTNDCSDLCFQENVIFDIEKGDCICQEYYKFEYNNYCYHICPSSTFAILTNKYICSITIPENYYLDTNDNIYKKCYDKCKKCSQFGNEANNKCDGCIDGYKFITDSLAIEKNCYQVCNYYYYLNGKKSI